MGSGTGLWSTITFILFLQLCYSLLTNGTVSLLTIALIVAMIGSLVTFVALSGVAGSDPFSAATTGIVIAKTTALTVFIASIIDISLSGIVVSSGALPGWVFAFINLVVGGIAVFQAIETAKA